MRSIDPESLAAVTGGLQHPWICAANVVAATLIAAAVGRQLGGRAPNPKVWAAAGATFGPLLGATTEACRR